MSTKRQLAELKLYNLLDDELESSNHISMEYLLQKVKSKSVEIIQFEHFQCEECLKSAIEKFPDCFFISQRNNVHRTNAVNLPNNYYNNYYNCFNIGSMVNEALTVLESLWAKLKLYEFLIDILEPQKELPLAFIEKEFFKKSNSYKSIFKCQHIMIEAIKEFYDIFEVKFYSDFQIYSVLSKYTSCYEEGGLWKVFNTDCLLQIISSTFLQLSAEIQVMMILNEHLQSGAIHLPNLYLIAKTSSKFIHDYFSNQDDLKTFISILPDLFYISRRNRILINKNVKNPKLYWYESERTRTELFDNLLLELNEVFTNQLTLYKLAQILKLKLKNKNHISMTELQISSLYPYCKDLKRIEDLKNDILVFPGIFHFSQLKNILLLERHWNNNGIQQSHKPKSESLLIYAIKSCSKMLKEIHLYCSLIFTLLRNQCIHLSNFLLLEFGLCEKYSITKETILEIIQKYPDRFYMDNGSHFIYLNVCVEDMLSDEKTVSNNAKLSGSNESSISATSSQKMFSGLQSLTSNNNAVAIDMSDILEQNSNCALKLHKTFGNNGEITVTDTNTTEILKLEFENQNTMQTTTHQQICDHKEPIIFANETKSIKDSNCSDIKKGFTAVLTNCGIICAIAKTEGYITTKENDIIPVIVDVVYSYGKQIENLYDVQNEHVHFIAIEDDGIMEDNWKTILAWTGDKPKNIPCAITSKTTWDTIKISYEKRYKETKLDFPVTVLNPDCEIIKLDYNDSDEFTQ